MDNQITNALTIDLEDWPQSVLDPRLPVTDHVCRNTDRILTLLDRVQLKATFFALGKVCERFPTLLPEIASAGHEIASHGFGHQLVHQMKPEAFADDLRRSIQLIESQIGKKPIGYRAPAFSISKETMWCGPIMADLGIRYSSSIFPIAGRRYGIPDAPRFPHRWPNCNVIEFPLTTLRRFGRNLPACGGGYLRMLPVPVLSAAIRGANRQRQPAVVYLHPYELAVNELDVLRQRGWRIAWRTHLHQSLFRGRVAARLAALCRRFKFAPMGTVLGFDKTAPACPVTTRPDNAAVSPQRQGLITVGSST